MFHRPVKLLGFGLLSVAMLSVLAGCQAMNQAFQKPAPEQPQTQAQPEVAAPVPAKPVECPKPRTITRKVTVYTPVKIGNKQVFGEAEMGHIPALSLRFPARIDTGARTTSLHATNIELFERDGKDWVRFQNDRSGNGVQNWELPLKRMVRIKRKQGGSIERPVVELKIQVGDVIQRLEVNLADRGNFEYPLLIGRDFLQDLVIVDVSKSYIADQPENRPATEGRQ